jgi:hypothetical protein
MIMNIAYLIIFLLLLFIAVKKFNLKRIIASPFKKHWHFQLIATFFSLISVYAIIRFLDASLDRTLLFWILFIAYIVLVFLTNHEGTFTRSNLILNAKNIIILLLLVFFMLNIRPLALPKYGNAYGVSTDNKTDINKQLSDTYINIRKNQIQDTFIPEKFLRIENNNNIKKFRNIIEQMPLTECVSWTKAKVVKFDISDGAYSIYVYKNGYVSISVRTDEIDEYIYYKVNDNYDLISKLQPIIERELLIKNENNYK